MTLEKDLLMAIGGGVVLTIASGLIDYILTPRPSVTELLVIFFVSTLLCLYAIRERRNG